MMTITNYFQKIITQLTSSKEDWEKVECLLRKIARMQKQLRMYKEFWDNSPEAFLLIREVDGQVLDANPTACSLYGYTLEEMPKITMYSLTTEPQCTRAAADDKVPFVPLRNHINRDGGIIQITATITYFNDQGTDVCACIIRLVHERRMTDGSIKDRK